MKSFVSRSNYMKISVVLGQPVAPTKKPIISGLLYQYQAKAVSHVEADIMRAVLVTAGFVIPKDHLNRKV